MNIVLYGIRNCDTVKKARRWLDDQGIDYRFHDFHSDGLDAGLLARLEAGLGWEQLLNRRSSSWRQLEESQRSDLDQAKALQLMLATPTLIKRPVLEKDGALWVGFSASDYQAGLL